MDPAEIEAAAEAFEAAAARGEYFPRAWFDRLAVDDVGRLGRHHLVGVLGREDGREVHRHVGHERRNEFQDVGILSGELTESPDRVQAGEPVVPIAGDFPENVRR